MVMNAVVVALACVWTHRAAGRFARRRAQASYPQLAGGVDDQFGRVAERVRLEALERALGRSDWVADAVAFYVAVLLVLVSFVAWVVLAS